MSNLTTAEPNIQLPKGAVVELAEGNVNELLDKFSAASKTPHERATAPKAAPGADETFRLGKDEQLEVASGYGAVKQALEDVAKARSASQPNTPDQQAAQAQASQVAKVLKRSGMKEAPDLSSPPAKGPDKGGISR
ncbi:MAG: hypothetical protein MK052_03360 [Alphaproteobacteria bacterium]|nr:hypothetical protein [Alphaproteobacteria bacterium]